MAHVIPVTFLAMVLRALGWLAVTTVIFCPLEAIVPVDRDKGAPRNWRANLGWFFLNSLMTLPVLALISASLAWAISSLEPRMLAMSAAALPLWVRLVLAMLIGELGFYWGHRWSHEWPWLWKFHCIHHAPDRLHYLINTQMHPIDMIFTRSCGLILLLTFGLATTPAGNQGLTLPLILVLGSGWSYFVHANLAVRLGLLEKVFATPFFHHWHHARTTNRGFNYAAMLPVFDLVFGTYHQPKDWPTYYGIDETLPSDLAGQLMFPFGAA